jgi:hypothetical protein
MPSARCTLIPAILSPDATNWRTWGDTSELRRAQFWDRYASLLVELADELFDPAQPFEMSRSAMVSPCHLHRVA